jgi:hypothetical protein
MEMVIKIKKESEVKARLLELEIALVIDNTGSMGGEIAQVQKGLGDLVNRIVAHHLKPKASFAVIGYRDHPPQDSSYVSHTFCDLEADMARVHQALALMRAHGGGDGPEAVVDGLQSALNLRWAKMSQKSIILVGDAPPHGERGSGDGFPKGCPCGWNIARVAERLIALGITGHAVGVRSDPTMALTFSGFAKSTGGIFVHLDRLTDLIPALIRRIDEEMGKIAADLRTIEKIERGGAVTDEDRESIERLEKKGVRVMEPPPSSGRDAEPPKKPRIRILS